MALNAIARILLLLLIALWTVPALALDTECVRRDRQVTRMDSWNKTPKEPETVRGYQCGGLRIEFIRLSESAVAMLERGNSKSLDAAIGAAQLLETTPLRQYREFRERFGTRYLRKMAEELPYVAKENDAEVELHVIFNPGTGYDGSPNYPALTELRSLSQGSWPDNLRIFTSAVESGSPLSGIPTLWRSLSAADLLSFTENARQMDQYLRQISSAPDPGFVVPVENKEFDFLLAASYGSILNELVRIQGRHGIMDAGCNPIEFIPAKLSSATPRYFEFQYEMPELLFDALLVRNTTKSAITLAGYRGSKSVGEGIRAIGDKGKTISEIDDLAQNIAIGPGKSVVLPTALLLRATDLAPCCDYVSPDEKEARQAVKQYAQFGYGISMAQYKVPEYPAYFQLLPSYNVAGLKTSRGNMTFERTRPLRLSFTATVEEGSCPYLMSRSGIRRSEPWTDYGKILHSASAVSKKSAHIESIDGAPRAYRLEEREPEIAFIDSVKLTVFYDDGSSANFVPNLDRLKHIDGDEIRIGWGEAFEFEFPVSDSPDRRSASHSELEVVGFYQRFDYSAFSKSKSGQLDDQRKSAIDDNFREMSLPTVRQKFAMQSIQPWCKIGQTSDVTTLRR